MRTFAGSHQTLQIPRPLADALRALAQREGATPFMVGMAVFQVLMHRYTQQDDISVGTPIAGRYRKELQGMLGFFTNTLVIRTDFSGNPTFRQLLGRVREAALGAYDHQELPFEKLVLELNPERSLSHTPLFQVMFVLQNLPPAERTPAGLAMTQVKSERGNSKFDLMLSMIEHADGMTGSIEYATDLFDPATITRMCGHFRTLVEAIVANPDREVALLPMLSPTERDQLLHAFNETKTDFPTDRCLPELIEEQAARTPRAIAVVDADGTDLTYRALNARANQLAHHLRALGVGPEVKVGIAIDARSTWSWACWDPEGGRRLRSARPHLSGGPPPPDDRGGGAPVSPDPGGVCRRAAEERRKAGPDRRRWTEHQRAGPGQPGPGRRARRPRLPALHLGLDREAQGRDCRTRASRTSLRGHRPLRRHGGGPGAAVRDRQLRRAHRGDLSGADGGRGPWCCATTR